MPRIRNYIYVPYEDKDEAKKLGAIWDNKERKFYIPYYLDKSPFEKWKVAKDKQIDTNEALIQFKEALNAQGLMVDTPIMNGKIQRCQTIDDKAGEKSGAYKGFLDGYPAGYIQNFKTGYKANWKFQLSNQAKQTTIINQNKKVFYENTTEKERLLNLQLKTALRLEKEFKEAKTLEESHPYLLKKGLNELYNIKIKIDNFQNILIPLKDENGKIWSLQRISKDGKKIIGVIKNKEEKEKNIEYSARKKGCFYTQKPLQEQDEFLLCEGFATAMTIQKALNKTTIMAVDAANMIDVAKKLNEKYPNKKITIFADNDLKQEIKGKNNIGIDIANKIKKELNNVKVIIPKINNYEALKGISDFNDIYLEKGINEVIKQYKENLKEQEMEEINNNIKKNDILPTHKCGGF